MSPDAVPADSLLSNEFAITLQDVQAAAHRIQSRVVRTPCIYNERISKELSCRIFFKAENLQHIGAFKARGALNAVLSLSEEQAAQGVVTHSSGNHAAALARAAALRGMKAYIVMPENSAKNKIASVRSFGVEPIFCEPTAEAREATAEQIRQQTGATLVHPYNNPLVMAGQGTVGLEILHQVDQVDAIIAPVGGGGLLSGILTAVKSQRPGVEVIAAEPAWADDAYRSLQQGSIQPANRYDTVADGLRTPLGTLTFPIIRALLTEILLVSEESILRGMRRIAEVARLVVEPSGAVSLAAVSEHADRFQHKTIVVVLSGGNLDFGDCHLGGAGRPENDP